jgi:DNA polymerase-4
VGSGVPLRVALRRCPDAVFLPVDREAYEAASAEVMATLREGGRPVEPLGWDEAFAGVASDDPGSVARSIQRDVLARTALHCTVGIGQTKVQAKMATGFGKPAGVYTITDDQWLPLFGERPTDALWGIGTRIAGRLADIGIATVGELAGADPDQVAAHFGPTTGPWLVRLGQGRLDSPVRTGPPGGPLPQPGADVPAGAARLGGCGAGGGHDGPGSHDRHRGRRPDGHPDLGEDPLRAVQHPPAQS